MKHRLVVVCVVFIATAWMVCWLSSHPQSTPKLRDPHRAPAISPLPMPTANAKERSAPAAPASAASAIASPQDASFVRMKRLLSGDPVRGKISRDVINTFLAERNRSAQSLLAAWQESGNADLLREAAETYPDDPRVQLTMLATTELSDEERIQWITRFKASAPDNALANYYAAAEFLKAKDMEGALAELSAGNAKSRYDDYMMEQVAERHALFRAAGLPETEAQMQAMFGAQMPFLQVLNKIRGELVPKITERIAAGDTRGAIDLGATGVTMAAQMQTGSASHVILNELVAIAIERAILESLGSAPADQLLGKSSADRLAALGERRAEIRDLTQTIDPGSHDLSADDLTRYFQLLVSDGEMQALQWLKAQKR
jgi:hypothetical protein